MIETLRNILGMIVTVPLVLFIIWMWVEYKRGEK